MFTDRFIKVPVEVVDLKTSEITGNEENSITSYIKLNPFEILSYRPHYTEEWDLSGYTTIDFKNDTNIIILMSIEDFEKLLNEYQK